MDTKNIFVIGLNDFNLGELKTIDKAENYNFIRVFNKQDLRQLISIGALVCHLWLITG